MNPSSLRKYFSYAARLLRHRPPGIEESLLSLAVFHMVQYLYPYTWPAPLRGILLVKIGAVGLLMACAAIRHRIDPLWRSMYGGMAIMCMAVGLVSLGSFVLRDYFVPQLRWRSFWSNVFPMAVSLGCLVSFLYASVRGIRKRPEAVPAFVVALTDKRNRVRRRAAIILGQIGGMETRLAGDKGQFRYLSRWLMKPGIEPATRRAISTLISALQDEDAVVRCEAAWALTQIDPGATEKVL